MITMFQTYFITFLMQQINTMKDKTTTFHWCSQRDMMSSKKWFKKFFSKLICLLIIISVLSLSEWITRSSSTYLEEIQLTVIANWIFLVWFYLRLFMVSFKFGLISSMYSLIDSLILIVITFMYNIVVATKASYCYWFSIIFFSLKKF